MGGAEKSGTVPIVRVAQQRCGCSRPAVGLLCQSALALDKRISIMCIICIISTTNKRTASSRKALANGGPNKNLRCRREAARRSLSFKLLLNHSRTVTQGQSTLDR